MMHRVRLSTGPVVRAALALALLLGGLVLALLLGGLVNGGRFHAAFGPDAAAGAGVRDPVAQGHGHDRGHHRGHDRDSDDPAGRGDAGPDADHGGAHHHIDADAAPSCALAAPRAAPAHAAVAGPAVIAWATPPPRRPPPTPVS